MNKIERHKIIETLQSLNLKYEDKGQEWIQCQCPNPHHQDKNPSAGINTFTGIVNCFSCNYTKHLSHVIMDNMNCDYNTAIKMLNIGVHDTEKHPTINLQSEKKQQQKRKKRNVEKNFMTIDVDVSQYKYAKLRGFTKEFCKKFNIEIAPFGYYKDYMIIPIIGNGINSYEARKVMEYEYLLKYFNISSGNYSKLKEKFYNIDLNDIIKNDIYYYLNKPKTLYPKGVNINNTLWNYDNLNFNEELYVVEGLGSIPKIYENISTNVTCTFGSKISNTQIHLLRKFKKIIVIPDNDKGGMDMIRYLNLYVKNVWVKKILSEDTDSNYEKDIKETTEIEVSRLLTRTFFKTAM